MVPPKIMATELFNVSKQIDGGPKIGSQWG